MLISVVLAPFMAPLVIRAGDDLRTRQEKTPMFTGGVSVGGTGLEPVTSRV